MTYTSEHYGRTRTAGVARVGSPADFVFFLVLLLFVCWSPAIRLYGGAGFVAFLFVAYVYVVAKDALFYRPSIRQDRAW